MSYAIHAQTDLPWEQVKDQPFEGWYWCDPDGAHMEPSPPEQTPRATHLWAWGPSKWGRWRIDPFGGGAATLTGALLECSDDHEAGALLVEPTLTSTSTWPVGAPVGLADELRGCPLNLLRVTQPVQLTFLAFAQSVSR